MAGYHRRQEKILQGILVFLLVFSFLVSASSLHAGKTEQRWTGWTDFSHDDQSKICMNLCKALSNAARCCCTVAVNECVTDANGNPNWLGGRKCCQKFTDKITAISVPSQDGSEGAQPQYLAKTLDHWIHYWLNGSEAPGYNSASTKPCNNANPYAYPGGPGDGYATFWTYVCEWWLENNKDGIKSYHDCATKAYHELLDKGDCEKECEDIPNCREIGRTPQESPVVPDKKCSSDEECIRITGGERPCCINGVCRPMKKCPDGILTCRKCPEPHYPPITPPQPTPQPEPSHVAPSSCPPCYRWDGRRCLPPCPPNMLHLLDLNTCTCREQPYSPITPAYPTPHKPPHEAKCRSNADCPRGCCMRGRCVQKKCGAGQTLDQYCRCVSVHPKPYVKRYRTPIRRLTPRPTPQPKPPPHPYKR